jgi:hypothetical protein
MRVFATLLLLYFFVFNFVCVVVIIFSCFLFSSFYAFFLQSIQQSQIFDSDRSCLNGDSSKSKKEEREYKNEHFFQFNKRQLKKEEINE